MKGDKKCCSGHHVCGILLLVIAVVWLISDWGVLTNNVPWLPLFIVFAIAGKMIKHHLIKK